VIYNNLYIKLAGLSFAKMDRKHSNSSIGSDFFLEKNVGKNTKNGKSNNTDDKMKDLSKYEEEKKYPPHPYDQY
jgi:hypothetical protein